MRLRTSLAMAGVALTGVVGLAAAAAPAQAAGDTERHLGCAAHWRNTAAWNECENSPGVSLQLQVKCSPSGGYTGLFKYVKGSMYPVDRWECPFKVTNAFNAYDR
jgi:hypothetical protein